MDDPLAKMFLLLIAGILGVGACFVALTNWRRGVVIVFIIFFLEDAVRKLLPGQPAWVMLLKIPLCGVVYLGFLVSSRSIWGDTRRPLLHLSLLIFGSVVLVQCANPNIIDWRVPVIGLI